MKFQISDKSGSICIGKIDFFWINQSQDKKGCCGIEIYPIDDLDGYILFMIGTRWKFPFSWDFYAFGRHWSHWKDND